MWPRLQKWPQSPCSIGLIFPHEIHLNALPWKACESLVRINREKASSAFLSSVERFNALGFVVFLIIVEESRVELQQKPPRSSKEVAYSSRTDYQRITKIMIILYKPDLLWYNSIKTNILLARCDSNTWRNELWNLLLNTQRNITSAPLPCQDCLSSSQIKTA